MDFQLEGYAWRETIERNIKTEKKYIFSLGKEIAQEEIRQVLVFCKVQKGKFVRFGI